MDSRPTRLIPLRMLNEWTYCPRLGVLEWVHGEWAENHYTVDGTWKHRRVDQPSRSLEDAARVLAEQEVDAEASEVTLKVRSVWLESEEEGLAGKMDVVDVSGSEVCPVDTKRGKLKAIPEQVWEPERVQLCAQGLLLRSAGWPCTKGYIYFVDSRRRVEVLFDDELVARTRALAADFRRVAEAGELPEPLEDSPKCGGCSLVGICLPDETRLMARLNGDTVPEQTRRIAVRDDLRTALIVTESRAKVGTSKGVFVVRIDGKTVAQSRARETSQISIFGRAQVSTQALRSAMDEGIPVAYFTYGGYFVGMAHGHAHRNVVLRQHQFAAACDKERSLAVAVEIVRGKVRNQRTMLRRNGAGVAPGVLREMRRLADAARGAKDLAQLLGFEGAAAALYFKDFRKMLKTDKDVFDATGRNRRPPRDPVNAVLSYTYALLTRELTATALTVGFDPYMGLYHQPRYGKPSLALDLMEEVRPLIADSVTLWVFNNGDVKPGHFVSRGDGCSLTSAGRKAVLGAYERRLAQEITHPIFGYRASWRRVLEIQTRLLGRHLLGEIPRYVPIETR